MNPLWSMSAGSVRKVGTVNKSSLIERKANSLYQGRL